MVLELAYDNGACAWFLSDDVTEHVTDIAVEADIRPDTEPHLGIPKSILKDDYGLKETVLDALDYHIAIAKRMRHDAPADYEFYTKVGAHVVPPLRRVWDRITKERLEPWFWQTLPAFGAVAPSLRQEEMEEENRKKRGRDSIYARFYSFRKATSTPPDTEMASLGESVYKLLVYFDSKVDGEWKNDSTGIPICGYLAVSPTGDVRLLRQMLGQSQYVHHKGGGSWRGRVSAIPHRGWGVPKLIREFAAFNDVTPFEVMRSEFVFAANIFVTASMSSMIQIRAEKDGVCCLFSIDHTKTPEFFKDRHACLTPNGNKKRVIHLVKVHTRRLADGRERGVRLHFRGERQFQWNGYSVNVVIPGKTRAALEDMSFSGIELGERPSSGYVDHEQLADAVSKYMKTGNPEDFNRIRTPPQQA